MITKDGASFWDLEVVQELNPSEKLFYLYLHTSPAAALMNPDNSPGKFKLSTELISQHTGFSIEVVNSLIRRFEYEYNLISYSDGIMSIGGLHG